MEHDRATPPAPPLETELREGLHLDHLGGIGGDTRRGEVGRFVRCAQAAMLRLAAEIHDSDRRRYNDVQALHERLARLEAGDARRTAYETARSDVERERRERREDEREDRAMNIALGKLGLTVLGILLGVPGVMLVLAQLLGLLP